MFANGLQILEYGNDEIIFRLQEWRRCKKCLYSIGRFFSLTCDFCKEDEINHSLSLAN